ncbi:hypothetical protein BDR04DRAFT_1100567 [Suillus decipiens]|nr:hypothetical protein BDR04DRAFT_1100567 [Suillus decipiens]
MIAFSGSLSSKLKADLLEITQALDISLDGAQNNPECLDGCPQLKDDLQFTGLYGCLPRGQKCTPESLLSILQSIVNLMTCNT